MWRLPVLATCVCLVYGKLASGDVDDSADKDLGADSGEHLGAAASQVYNHPYAASIVKNGNYTCSAVILNTNWLLTLSKCFDADIVSTYVSHKKLSNYTVRAGSSYNTKRGSMYKIKMLINNFDLKVSAVKLETPLVFGSRIQSVLLPSADEEVALGRLASIVAWTPDGHMRLVNVPIIEASICEDNTKLLPGHYICVGGVQDPNRNFCRKDNGGAVIQNNTLIALATFVQTCAIYTRQHAFPKVSAFVHWLDSVIWDESNRPTTTEPSTPEEITKTEQTSPVYDQRSYMLTLPYAPVNLPLEPGENNAVMPRISLYESYLQNMERAKTTTTEDPGDKELSKAERARMQWFQKYGRAVMAQRFGHEKNEQYDYE